MRNTSKKKLAPVDAAFQAAYGALALKIDARKIHEYKDVERVLAEYLMGVLQIERLSAFRKGYKAGVESK